MAKEREGSASRIPRGISPWVLVLLHHGKGHGIPVRYTRITSVLQCSMLYGIPLQKEGKNQWGRAIAMVAASVDSSGHNIRCGNRRGKLPRTASQAALKVLSFRGWRPKYRCYARHLKRPEALRPPLRLPVARLMAPTSILLKPTTRYNKVAWKFAQARPPETFISATGR